LHLKAWFGGPAHDEDHGVRHRSVREAPTGASAAATINHELAIVKRAFTLPIRAGKHIVSPTDLQAAAAALDDAAGTIAGTKAAAGDVRPFGRSRK
jgi:hypothetical protein